ncbi:hypothetical protein [Kutzneria sp. NPDC052558]|uniref:hypothetical protein n=1 Tax=Kutzneria sp. NPDC052558 TaxID=3364121 RepID=UPI0037CC108C
MTEVRPAEPAGRTRPCLGQHRELAALTTQLDIRAGGLAVTVSGPPDVGKTRLLAEFARIAAERGPPVVTTGPADDPRRLRHAAPARS